MSVITNTALQPAATVPKHEKQFSLELMDSALRETSGLIICTESPLSSVAAYWMGRAYKRCPIIVYGPPNEDYPFLVVPTVILFNESEVTRFIDLIAANNTMPDHQTRILAAAVYFGGR